MLCGVRIHVIAGAHRHGIRLRRPMRVTGVDEAGRVPCTPRSQLAHHARQGIGVRAYGRASSYYADKCWTCH